MRYNYHDSRHVLEVNCFLKNTLVACVPYKIIYTSERFHFYTRLKLEPGHSNVFCEKIVLKNFEKFHRKTTMMTQNADLILRLFKKKSSPLQVSPCGFCQSFQARCSLNTNEQLFLKKFLFVLILWCIIVHFIVLLLYFIVLFYISVENYLAETATVYR